jgi:nicotinamide riboside transporter PnuC
MQWLITTIALAGVVLNARGKWQGFLFWLVSNAYWTWHNATIGEYAQAALLSVFWLLALYGLAYWRTHSRKYSDRYSAPMYRTCGKPKKYGGPLWLDHAICERSNGQDSRQ